MPVSCDNAGDKAPEKSADHGSRHIRGHGAAHAASGPFLINVGEHNGDDTRYEKALGETPEDERMPRLVEVAARAVGMVSRNSEGTMTFLRPRRSAIMPIMGAVRAVARIVALTVKLTSQLRGMKSLAQERQQRLSAVDVEKRTHAGEHDRGDRLVELSQKRNLPSTPNA